ncbi:hypothetical protein QOZ80_8AG0630570 [Eleusine coracana subsp. coracana]|nr:hypothetical protein QOZ80_8AG0630540 [Eleusine coracana subsp. coracana]KAK3123422.1 hypothetical protein QOZ80_8AG0630570 [Eleusine coracana subsp. coracana]
MAMDAAAQLAADAGIPRGRVVSLAAVLAFLLGASWMAIFRSILGSADRCLAVEGSVWGDYECRLSIQYISAAVAISLTMMLVLRYGEAAARKGAAGGARDARPDRGLGSASAESEWAHATAFFNVYLLCFALIFAGMMQQRAGAQRLLEDPCDEEAASLVKSGRVYTNVGFLAMHVQHCCLAIPYWLLRLMGFLRENCVGSPTD